MKSYLYLSLSITKFYVHKFRFLHFFSKIWIFIHRWMYRLNRAEAKEAAQTTTTLEQATNKKSCENCITDRNLSVITDIKSL